MLHFNPPNIVWSYGYTLKINDYNSNYTNKKKKITTKTGRYQRSKSHLGGIYSSMTTQRSISYLGGIYFSMTTQRSISCLGGIYSSMKTHRSISCLGGMYSSMTTHRSISCYGGIKPPWQNGGQYHAMEVLKLHDHRDQYHAMIPPWPHRGQYHASMTTQRSLSCHGGIMPPCPHRGHLYHTLVLIFLKLRSRAFNRCNKF